MTKVALYPGSFDPITSGHLDIITRAAKMYDKVIVGVATNLSKNTLFTIEERVSVIKDVVKDIKNVEVATFSGLLADYVNTNNIDVVVRGLRATTDFEYEIQLAQMNARLFDERVETIFLMTSPKYSFISSSIIKEVVSLNGNVEGLVPTIVLKAIKEKYDVEEI